MNERPTGTVTFLFTDIEGSTRLWQHHPEEMTVALSRHDEIVRAAIGGQRGVVFSTAGDSFAAAFWTPQEAVTAALAAQAALGTQEWPEPEPLRVRMGVHTGIAAERDGDYFGPTLNRAARIMAAGHGGQVVVSDVTAKLLSGVDVHDLGEYRLKDLADVERVWQVGLGVFAPLRAAPVRLGTLPVVSRSFVGRVDDCTRLGVEVQPGRVVTLTGPGGMGKTRLALQVAHQLVGEFADGVWWCDLTPIDDGAGLVTAVAAMLSIMLHAELSPIESLVDALRGRRALVVFDNCEHVLDAAADLVDAIVNGCTTVAALATSREPLGLTAERVWPLRSLDPDLEGVELFLERAAATDATFTIDDDRAVVVELCRHLDGLPLAIELAAGRVRTMTATELLARLDDRFRLLRGGTRGGMDRHRTLVATLDWSYSLLGVQEKVLLDRLAVFAGTFNVTAVETVCTGDAIDPLDGIDLLASLVDKSMVTVERSPVGTRYRLLETVRHYSEGHLIEQGELARLRHRHLDHYVAVAETAWAGWLDDYTSGRVVFDREWDNLRAATQYAITIADMTNVERMLAPVLWHSIYTMRFEVADWAVQAADLPGAGPATFGAAAFLGSFLGRFDDAQRFAYAGIAAADTPDAPATISCWIGLALSCIGRREPGLMGEAAKAAQRTGGLGVLGDALMSAVIAGQEAITDPAGAAQWARRAETLIAGHRNPAVSADVLSNLALYYGLAGDPARGVDYCQQALTLARAHHALISVMTAHAMLAQVAAMGGVDDPTAVLREAIGEAYRDRIWLEVWMMIEAQARWWANHDHLEAAGIAVGYLDAHQVGSASLGITDVAALTELRG